eukprot:15378515-Alexandrium_andersonii.AAC.1
MCIRDRASLARGTRGELAQRVFGMLEQARNPGWMAWCACRWADWHAGGQLPQSASTERIPTNVQQALQMLAA